MELKIDDSRKGLLSDLTAGDVFTYQNSDGYPVASFMLLNEQHVPVATSKEKAAVKIVPVVCLTSSVSTYSEGSIYSFREDMTNVTYRDDVEIVVHA